MLNLGDYKLDPPDDPDPLESWERFLEANSDELSGFFQQAELLLDRAKHCGLGWASWSDFIAPDLWLERDRWLALKKCAAQRKGAQAK